MNDKAIIFDDPLNLLRSLRSELERLARGGHPFAIILLRVHSTDHKDIILKTFRNSTRIFDEIFEYKNETDVLLSL